MLSLLMEQWDRHHRVAMEEPNVRTSSQAVWRLGGAQVGISGAHAILQTWVQVQTARIVPLSTQKGFQLISSWSDKHPSTPPSQALHHAASLPSIPRGSLGEKQGKRKGRGEEKGEEETRRQRKGRERSKRGKEGEKEEGREEEREPDSEERRGASQAHGIQKKQLSKALAGMQICRIPGPIIPWHTKLAGGISVPKRGSQNKQHGKNPTPTAGLWIKNEGKGNSCAASCRWPHCGSCTWSCPLVLK